jgi:hypothetical protein
MHSARQPFGHLVASLVAKDSEDVSDAFVMLTAKFPKTGLSKSNAEIKALV